MPKSTHRGHCQCCGALQMLPNGHLAKHGYTVRCGFFDGICRGTGHLPFERDCSLVESFIKAAAVQLASVRKSQAELRQPATSDSAWIHDYRNGSFRERSGYVWRYVKIVAKDCSVPSGHSWIEYHYTDVNGQDRRIDHYGNRPESAIDLATQLNAKYADSLDSTVSEIESYIRWQQDRVTNWKPEALQPVEVANA